MCRGLRKRLLLMEPHLRSFKVLNKFLYEKFAIEMRSFVEYTQPRNNGGAVFAATGLCCGGGLEPGQGEETQTEEPANVQDWPQAGTTKQVRRELATDAGPDPITIVKCAEKSEPSAKVLAGVPLTQRTTGGSQNKPNTGQAGGEWR